MDLSIYSKWRTRKLCWSIGNFAKRKNCISLYNTWGIHQIDAGFFAEMPEARARWKDVGGIPPRPSVPPERSGGGQSGFSAKWVLTFSNKYR